MQLQRGAGHCQGAVQLERPCTTAGRQPQPRSRSPSGRPAKQSRAAEQHSPLGSSRPQPQWGLQRPLRTRLQLRCGPDCDVPSQMLTD